MTDCPLSRRQPVDEPVGLVFFVDYPNFSPQTYRHHQPDCRHRGITGAHRLPTADGQTP
jgi:hypothetical protein